MSHQAAENIALHLRFDLAQGGRTREVIGLIERIIEHARLSRAVFTSPVSGRLPFVLVVTRSGCDDEELRRVIGALLGDADAMERAMAILERHHGGSCGGAVLPEEPPDPVRE